jgi:kynurenine formamidase
MTYAGSVNEPGVASAETLLTEDEVRAYMQTLSNWGRWGKDDLRGTLNFIEPSMVKAALAMPELGEQISCAFPITYDRIPDDPGYPDEHNPAFTVPSHFMLRTGEGLDPDSPIRTAPSDAFLIAPHGMVITHVDTPSHSLYKGTMFNGVPASEVKTSGGAGKGGMELLSDGVIARGVLLDVPHSQGREWLDDGEAIFPKDLDRCEQECGVTVGRGDILILRTGYRKRNPVGPPRRQPRPGLQAACLPWLHEREISMIATDVVADVHPHGYDGFGMPIHTVGIWAMGLWLIDNCDVEQLAVRCRELERWEFLFVVAPIIFSKGTGSPVNPIAVF